MNEQVSTQREKGPHVAVGSSTSASWLSESGCKGMDRRGPSERYLVLGGKGLPQKLPGVSGARWVGPEDRLGEGSLMGPACVWADTELKGGRASEEGAPLALSASAPSVLCAVHFFRELEVILQTHLHKVESRKKKWIG